MLYGALDRKRVPLSPALHSLAAVRVPNIDWYDFSVDINYSTLAKRTESLKRKRPLR